MSGLWRDHAATPRQQQLPFTPKRKRTARPTQADVLIGLLRAARASCSPLELPAIIRAGIAQHGARFRELRERGFLIVNEMERADGVVRSTYRLILDPERDAQ
jgi:hypothetical protein